MSETAAVRFIRAIDLYVSDMVAEGRFNSAATERSYRATLRLHAQDVGNRDPSKTGRDDVMKTLRRWQHPNTRGVHRAHLVSFYDWCLENGYRKDNPARRTRAPKGRKPKVYRLTRDEVRALRAAARPGRERRIVDLGLLTGLRAQELLGLQGRHLRRPGWIWVSEDIAKGPNGRNVPVVAELQPVWQECADTLADNEYVLAHRSHGIHGGRRVDVWDPSRPMAYESLHRCVVALGKRAGIAGRVTPHVMRHAYGDHVTRYAGLKTAQFVMGHQSVATTQRYTGEPTLDEVGEALAAFGYGEPSAGTGRSNPLAATGDRFRLY
jgi:site-specific recombinase XerD